MVGMGYGHPFLSVDLSEQGFPTDQYGFEKITFSTLTGSHQSAPFATHVQYERGGQVLEQVDEQPKVDFTNYINQVVSWLTS